MEIKKERIEDMTFQEIILENYMNFMIVTLVFLFFGVVLLFVGKCFFRCLLVFTGIKTTGTVTSVKYDALSGFQSKIKSYKCSMSYELSNGESITSEWPIQQGGERQLDKIGKKYIVYYNRRKPKMFYSTAFLQGQFISTISVLLGIALVVAAITLAVYCAMVNYSLCI